MPQNLPPVFVFDLDNTLAECSETYEVSKQDFASHLIEHLPHLSEAEILNRFNALDQERYLELGTHPGRHPGSMIETAKYFFNQVNLPFPDHLNTELLDIGQAILGADYSPYPGALALLELLRAKGCRLAICTKGDRDIQEYKLNRHGYPNYVDAVHICHPKTSADLLKAAQLAAPEGWSRLIVIGDTRKDEIQAGQALGATTIWLTNPSINCTWGYDLAHSHIIPDFTLPTIQDVAPFLESHNFFHAQSVSHRAERPAPVKLSR